MAEKSDMSTVKLLESGKKARELLNMLNSPHLSAREMADLLSLVCVENSKLNAVLAALDCVKRFGAIEAIEKHPAIVTAIGLDKSSLSQIDTLNDRDPWLIADARTHFESIVRVQYSLKMNSLDPLSQLGGLVFDDPHGAERWESISPRVWTSWAGRGNNAIIRGSVKRGKTNFALLLCEHFLATGNFIVTSNIMVSGAPENYIYCPRLSDMLITICEARAVDKNVLIVLDEGSLYWARINTIMPVPQKLAKLVLVYGKAHANLLFLSHFEESIPGIVARTSCANFEKKGIKEVYVEVSEGIRIKPRLLTAVPATQLRYDPDQLQYLSMDLSVDALFDFWSSIPEGGDQWKLVLDYIHKHRGEVAEEQLDPKEIALWLRKHGKSEREIAAIVQRSPSTIHDWVSGQ